MVDAEIPSVSSQEGIASSWGNKVREAVHNLLTGHRHDGVLSRRTLYPSNRLAGIIPTFDTFDTDPSSPANMTDGDWTTESGEGVKTLAAAGVIGNIKFDLGAAYPVLVLIHMNVHRDSGDGSISVYIGISDDGITYADTPAVMSGVVANLYRAIIATFGYSRYYRIRINAVGTTGSSVYHVKVAEVMAIQLI